MKKNIVIIISALNMGGAQKVSSLLANNWAKDGHKVTVICTFDKEIKKHYSLNKSINLIELNKRNFFLKNKYLNLIWKLISLRRLIVSQNPDLVISFLARINLAASISTFGLKTKLIICERSWPPFASLDRNFYWLHRIFLKRVDKFVVQTQKSKSWLSINFPNRPVEVIPNPCEYPIISGKKDIINPNSQILKTKKIILASGRLHKVKQFDLLIKAYSRIKDSYLNWDLVILGEGKERKLLESMVLDYSLSKRVFLPGEVGNIYEWYERADLFVLSSLIEGFPNVLLEAMSYGVPSISFDCNTGPSDMIKQGVNGLLINPQKKDQGLSEAIEELILNKEYRTKLSENSVLVREKYSVNNIMQLWNDILEL